VEKVLQGDQEVNYTHENNELFIITSNPSKSNEQTRINIVYSGIPVNGLRIGLNKYGDRGFFSKNWPDKARNWLAVVDHPYEKATCDFVVTAPSKYSIISNGLKKEESIIGTGVKKTHWKQSVPISSWLYVLGASEFAIQYLDTFEGKSIESWVYKQDRDIGFDKLSFPVKESLEFFSDYIGPYSYEKMASIMSPSVGGAMETASAVFYTEKSYDESKSFWLRNAIAHEIAHHWFGNSVTEFDWDDAWLSEGLTTYFTLAFREHVFGYDDYISGLIEARKQTIDFYSKQPDYQIVDNNYEKYDGSPTSSATYQKGAWVMHMLKNKVGKENFKKGIRSYYKRFRDSTAVTKDFINEMERASNIDLDAFFNQWLFQGGIPELKLDWVYNAKKKVVNMTIEQTQSSEYIYPELAIEVEILGGNKRSKQVTIELNDRKQKVSIPFDSTPNDIVIDPQTNLLAKWNMTVKK
jgi:aminopeptidase N